MMALPQARLLQSFLHSIRPSSRGEERCPQLSYASFPPGSFSILSQDLEGLFRLTEHEIHNDRGLRISLKAVEGAMDKIAKLM
jgi:hypothetical protein